ncbi:hypothetical protein ACHQM5_024812 [Ranunculus cassubicifolius]
MEYSLPTEKAVKRLSELLQEQQEPFNLDVYLMERGYLKKLLNSKGNKELKRRKRIPLCPKILKKVLNKLVPAKTAKGEHEFDQFSSTSSVSVCDSYSETDMEEENTSQTSNLCDSNGQVENKQHSPVSVLEELPSDDISPLHNHVRCCSRSYRDESPSTSNGNGLPKRVTEESILSASLWGLLEGQGNVGVKELLDGASSSSSSSSQYVKTKRVVEQTKQLLFDCVREVLETQGSNEKDFLGGEEIGKMVCEKVCFWAKQSGNVANVNQLRNAYYWESLEEWNALQPHVRKIGLEISNHILEELEVEIVIDIIDSF